MLAFKASSSSPPEGFHVPLPSAAEESDFGENPRSPELVPLLVVIGLPRFCHSRMGLPRAGFIGGGGVSSYEVDGPS